jgi:hypothetical protein
MWGGRGSQTVSIFGADHTSSSFPISEEFLGEHFSEVFNISSISILTIFFIFYTFNNFSYNSNKNYKFQGIKELFSNHKSKLYLAFVLTTIYFSVNNFFFNYVYRGEIYREATVLTTIYRFFLLLGFYFCACIFLDFENSKKKIVKIFFFNTLMGFFISISIASRAMFIDQLVIFFSVLHKIKYNFSKIILFLLVFFFSIVSIFFVTLKRDYLYKINSITTTTATATSIATTINLMTERWIGIDGISNVISYKEKNLSIYFNALKEKKKNKLTFYNSLFFTQTTDDPFYTNIKIPGFIAFSYYSGSSLILIISLTIIIITLIYIEKIFIYFFSNLLVLRKYLAFLIAYRIIHFGIYPVNTAYYILYIISLAFCLFYFDKILYKYYRS